MILEFDRHFKECFLKAHLILTFLLFVTMIFSSPCHSLISTVDGVDSSDQKILFEKWPSLKEKNPEPEDLDEAIRYLTLTGKYERVLVDQNSESQPRIIASPFRMIESIEIKGNRRISEGELRAQILFKPEDRFERKKIIESGERLKQFYVDRGYLNCIIEVNFIKNTEKSLSVTFLIQENAPSLIQEVRIQSTNKNLNSRLKRMTESLEGKLLSFDQVQKIRKRLELFLKEHRYLKSELYGPEAQYTLDKSEALLNFRVSDPYSIEFMFSGNKDLQELEIYQALSPDTIERGTADPAAEGSDRIRSFYQSQGFPNIEINTRIDTNEADFRRIVKFEIIEGERLKIQKLNVIGRISKPSSYYAQLIRENSSPIINRGFYHRQDLDKGIDNLLVELRNQGFLRAKLQSVRLEKEQGNPLTQVIVNLDEGPLTLIRSIEIEGARALSPEEILKQLSFKSGEPLKLNDLESSLEVIKNHYRNQGFLEVKILNSNEDLIQYNEKGTQADIHFRLREGPQVSIGKIRIEGNSFTQTIVVQRSIGVKEGDILNPEKMEEIEARINQLGLFSRVNVQTLEDGTDVAVRTLLIKLAERDPGTFKIGLGANSERELTLRGFMGLSYNNLGGTARGLSLRTEVKSHIFDVNYPQYEIVGSYTEPFLFESRSRGRVNLTRSERIFYFNTGLDLVNITASDKLDFFIEHNFDRHWRLSWKLWSFDSRKEFEKSGRCIVDDASTFDRNSRCSPNTQQIATIGPILDIEFRDNPLSPTRGHYTQFNLDYSNPILGSSGLIHFVRTEAGHSQYFQLLGPKLVWANSVRGGYVSNLSEKSGSGVPTSHAFFLGGLSTIRGFNGSEDRERIPTNIEFQVQRGNKLIIKNDSYFGLFKSELRFQVYQEHGGVFFYDGGIVKVSGYKFERPYRDSIGFGYRYITPMGPVSADLGFKINPRRDEEKFRFHFSLGTF